MAETQDESPQPLSYRDQHVDDTLDDHEQRITDNERRWLVAKGALGMLAAYEGVDFAVGQLVSLI